MNTLKLITIFLIFFFCSCGDSPQSPQPPVVTQPDYTPMWPQVGYNGRHTCNRYAPNVTIRSVDSGKVFWRFKPGQGSYGDGTESSIDAQGNIYHLSTLHTNANVIKFRPDGSVIWRRDTLMNDAYFGIAFSQDEKRIYYSDYSKFTCRDSSGNKIWSIPNYNPTLPALGKDGTIYCSISNNITALTIDGAIKWQLRNIGYKSWLSLDREDNIYFYNTKSGNSEVDKVDKNGNLIWKYDNIKGFVDTYYSIVIDGYNNAYFKTDSGLISLNKNGIKRWLKNNSYWSGVVPAITKDNHIISDSMRNVIAYDTSGNTLWKTALPDPLGSIEPYIALDDYDNIYFNYWNSNISMSVCSFDKSGNLRWNCYQPVIGFILPGLVLSPLGQIFDTPKRPNMVFSIR